MGFFYMVATVAFLRGRVKPVLGAVVEEDRLPMEEAVAVVEEGVAAEVS